MNKYGARKTRCNHNHLHDSMKEAYRCNDLYLLQQAGEISKLKQQPRFVLQKSFKLGKKKIRKLEYVADFEYIENGVRTIEDVKGRLTAVYKLKKKLFMYKYRNKKWRFAET